MSLPTGPLREGESFGPRYEVIRLLGMGGMGAVYQARDRELGVPVALKVIRSDAAIDGTPSGEAQARFKRELLLARQVTHRNVVRIHDIGDVDGVKYLTMPFVDGSDLAAVLRAGGTLPLPRALHIARQIADGLQAAHDAGVIHRDLKPANIMLEPDDHAVIMDFGIARPAAPDATLTNAIVGTLEYMAPEQLLGTADQRTDVYAVGIMLSEMIMGRERRAAATTDPSVPRPVARVIERCIAPAAGERYQTARDLLRDLEVLTGDRPSRPAWWSRPAVAAAAIALIAIVGLTVVYRHRSTAALPPAKVRPFAIAVVPFANDSGDAALDQWGSLAAEILRRALGDVSGIRVASGARVSTLLSQLHVTPSFWKQPDGFKPVGEFTSADAIVSGAVSRVDGGLRLEAAIDRTRVERKLLSVPLAGNDVVPAALRLASLVRAAVGAGAPPDGARPLSLPSESLPAMASYVAGTEALARADYASAERYLKAAIGADGTFALAFARLAECLQALRRPAEAEDAARQASSLMAQARLEDRDVIAATLAQVADEPDRRREIYGRLVQAHPYDTDLRLVYAVALETQGSYEQAAAELAQILDEEPRHLEALYTAGRVALRRDRVSESLEPLNRAFSLSVQLDAPRQKGTILQALGIAYKKLGKLDDALRQYEASIEIKRRIHDRAGEAASLGEMAQIYDAQGNDAAAVNAYNASIDLFREIGNRRGTARSLNDLGTYYLDRGRMRLALKSYSEALDLYRESRDELGEAFALSNLGAVYVGLGDYANARTNSERARDIRERAKVLGPLAETLTNLTNIAADQGDYERAETHAARALQLWREAGDTRGQAIGLTNQASVLRQRGRFGAALQNLEQATTMFQGLQDRGVWWLQIQMEHGLALSLAGRTSDAQRVLVDALSQARASTNTGLLAQALTYQGLSTWLHGSAAEARPHFEEAIRVASGGDAPIQTLWARVYLSASQLQSDPPGAVRELTTLAAEADRRGIRRASAECDLYRGAALINLRRSVQARAILDEALRKSERLGSRDLIALAHLRLSDALRSMGQTSAADQALARARTAAEAIRKDGAPQLYTRADFAALRTP